MAHIINNVQKKHPQYSAVKKLFSLLVDAGFTLLWVDDGGERVETLTPTSATDTVCSVDDSWPVIEKDGKHLGLFLVLGNDNSEIVADYTSHPELDRVVDIHADLYS